MKYFFIVLSLLIIFMLPSIGYSQSINNSTVKVDQEVKLITPIQ